MQNSIMDFSYTVTHQGHEDFMNNGAKQPFALQPWPTWVLFLVTSSGKKLAVLLTKTLVQTQQTYHASRLGNILQES